MTNRQIILRTLDDLLKPESFKDYGPNGLQVEGVTEIQKIVTGVTASQALIEAAIKEKADALLVHHGLFWRGQDGRVTGWLRQRLALLLSNNINLFAYHLPLDAHPEVGNNVQLGELLGWKTLSYFGDQNLGCIGVSVSSDSCQSVFALAEKLEAKLRRIVIRVEGDGRAIKKIAWCTGGAQNYFEAAVAAGADVFVTGEISEPQAHLARETGVAFLACGHHATERYGVQAVGMRLVNTFGIEHIFIDIDNPA